MNNSYYNYNDLYISGLKYGYEDYVAIYRHKLSDDGPIVQYANTANENTSRTLIPVKNFQNNANQTGIYDQSLLGEGYEVTNFKTSKIQLEPSFDMPILCDADNILSAYVFDFFDLAKKAVYGDAIEHSVKISGINGSTITLDNNGKYLIKLLKNSTNNGHTLYARIVDGYTLKSLSSLVEVNSLSANNSTVTLSSNPNISFDNRYLLLVFVFYKAPDYPLTQDLPPSTEDYEYSNEFYLFSSRDGLYYPCLINNLTFEINNSLPSLKVKTIAKRLSTEDRVHIYNTELLSNPSSVYSAPKCEQARIKITDVSGKNKFYGLIPIVPDVDTDISDVFFKYRSGIHFGDDLNDISDETIPLLIKSISLSVDNNIKPIYTIHTPRFSLDENEGDICDIGRQDNMFPYGFYSTGRKITGNLSLYIPHEEWFRKEFMPAISTNTIGSLEIDTGYMNITLSKMAFNLSPLGTSVNDHFGREVVFSYVSTSYQSMFEIAMSKTGGIV